MMDMASTRKSSRERPLLDYKRLNDEGLEALSPMKNPSPSGELADSRLKSVEEPAPFSPMDIPSERKVVPSARGASSAE